MNIDNDKEIIENAQIYREMCAKYGKIGGFSSSSFIKSLIKFYKENKFLTEKQIKAFKNWKEYPSKSYNRNTTMSDLDIGFWGANDFGSK